MRTVERSDSGWHMSLATRARRDQIIQAAAEVVAAVGYANASTARIAERAGISKGVITYHFESKDEIMRLVALRLLQRCVEVVDHCINEATNARDQVRAWISAELGFFATHRIHYLAMTDIMANHRDSDFSHAFDDEVRAETHRMAHILLAGQQQGDFRSFETEEVAHIILRCRDSVLDSWARSPERDLNVQIETLLDFIDHAVAARAD